jgi:hypothetical protein
MACGGFLSLVGTWCCEVRVDIDAGSTEFDQRSTNTLLRCISFSTVRFVGPNGFPTSDIERLRYLSKRSKRDRQATHPILIEKFARQKSSCQCRARHPCRHVSHPSSPLKTPPHKKTNQVQKKRSCLQNAFAPSYILRTEQSKSFLASNSAVCEHPFLIQVSWMSG